MQFQGPRNRFLARPFWRDYTGAYVLLGVGFIMVDIGYSQRGPSDRLFILVPAFALLGFGLVGEATEGDNPQATAIYTFIRRQFDTMMLAALDPVADWIQSPLQSRSRAGREPAAHLVYVQFRGSMGLDVGQHSYLHVGG